MDEYEKLEQDLKRQYESFVQKFISLSYLENQLDDYDRHEQEKMAEREVSIGGREYKVHLTGTSALSLYTYSTNVTLLK